MLDVGILLMLIYKPMKLRSTTPGSSRGLVTKSVAVAVAVMMAVGGPFALQQSVRADQYDDQIAAYEAEIKQYQSQANALGEQVKTLEGEKAALQAQIDTIRTQIELSKTKLEQIKAEIVKTQEQIDQNKELLGITLANMYAADKVSPLEMLAGSDNIADYVDQQEQRDSLSEQLTKTVDLINAKKVELEKQKADAERVLVDQQSSEKALADKEDEKRDLIARTQNDQNAYNSLVSDRQAKQLQAMQAQQAAIEAAMRAAGGGGSTQVIAGGSAGGYPWNSSNCYVDANAWSYGGADGVGTDGYGYGCRQCVSYVAWRVGVERGYVPVNWGNANDWVGNARRAGYTVSSTPKAGSAGVIYGGQYGHIVWVDSVNGDGTLTISQYNYFNAGGPGWGHYSKMIVPAATYQYFIYF